MSSTLTEEQRQRIEQNRLKAIERRNAVAASKMAATSSSATSSAMSRPTASIPPSNTTINLGATSKPLPPVSLSSQAIVKGSCVLISRRRFCVEMPYHHEAIQIFKSISDCRYEPMIKKWNFPMSEHDKLQEAMKPLRPNVTLGALPAFIRRIFKDVPPTISLEVDSEVLGRLDENLLVTLFQFQREGICLGVKRGGRILIADDMGLGKTIQALGIAHYYYSEWPLLIVTPSSMRYGWREAIWKWLPSVPAGSVTVIDSKAEWEFIGTSRVVIASYDSILKDKTIMPKVVIFDESHHLKNSKAARTKACVPIIRNAKRAILLTGTPALSRPIELFTQVSALKPDLFQYDEYGIRYCAGKKNAWGWDFLGASNMTELQLLLEETVMIRRMKSDVLTQLPAKRRQMLILDPKLVLKCSGKELKSKASAFNESKALKSGTEAHGKLLAYFSETANAKLEAVTSYIADLVEDGKKFLCFAHHRVILDGVSQTLESLKCKYIRIDGSTSAEERKKVCDLFQVNDDIRVAVLSIQAANAGITLTAANLIVFAELFWNPGILTQAEDRAHRIGQVDSVLVQYLVAKNTADDYLWRIVVDKLDVLNKVGLSKDNFQEADAAALIQHHHSTWTKAEEENKPPTQENKPLSQQSLINSYFPAVGTSRSTTARSASQPAPSTSTVVPSKRGTSTIDPVTVSKRSSSSPGASSTTMASVHTETETARVQSGANNECEFSNEELELMMMDDFD